MASPTCTALKDSPLRLLLPMPQELVLKGGGTFVLSGKAPLRVFVGGHALQFEAGVLEETLRAAGATCERTDDAARAHVALRVNAEVVPGREAYRLTVDATGVTVMAGGGAGALYGVHTLRQMLQLWNAPPMPRAAWGLPHVVVHDAPSLAQRGFMLDVSRDAVPTMATARALVDRLAALKFNQLQLYMEHTFAYPQHEAVWRDSSPFTAAEIRALDAYCAERHVELVPNQNTLGHMERWLQHAEYAHLAEVEEGIDHPFAWEGVAPYSLAPVLPAVHAFLDGLFRELLPHFSSRKVNVGLDEVYDLGEGKSAAACAQRGGAGRVYLEFIQRMGERCRAHNRTMQFWGDIVVSEPHLIPQLPADSVTLMWGYEADYPYEQRARLFRQHGVAFVVCPGTSSWNTFTGRGTNALHNIARAAVAAHHHHALGMLLTDWGDHGHMQPYAMADIGMVAAAAFGWNAATAANEACWHVPEWLDTHVYADDARVLGTLVWELSNEYLHVAPRLANAAPFHRLLVLHNKHARGPERLAGLSAHALDATHARMEALRERLATVRVARGDAALLASEVAWVLDAVQLSCRVGVAHVRAGVGTPYTRIPAAERRALVPALDALMADLATWWRARRREGGLARTMERLQLLRALLAGEHDDDDE